MTTITATRQRAPVVPNSRSVYERIESDVASYAITSEPSFQLELAREGQHWLVRDVPTGIFGCGDTPSDALGDFVRAAREHLEVLEHQTALTDELAAQLDYLRARTPRV